MLYVDVRRYLRKQVFRPVTLERHLQCCVSAPVSENIFLVYTNSTKLVMANETLGYAVLCTDAYIVDVRVNNIERTSSCFDVALPCGDHLLQHNQPVLACCLQYESKEALTHIPYGIYHIRAKVRALRTCKTASVSHAFRLYPLFLPCYLQVLFWMTLHFRSWEI